MAKVTLLLKVLNVLKVSKKSNPKGWNGRWLTLRVGRKLFGKNGKIQKEDFEGEAGGNVGRCYQMFGFDGQV